jgi:lysozyme
VIPKNRPQQKRADTLKQLAALKVSDPVCLVGIRGYFRDSMGAKGKNDVGLFDDAIILVSPNAHVAWNANVDPSRLGWNAKAGKPMAQLKPGVYRYRLGKHGINRGNPYPALVQAGPVTVYRGAEEETGWFGINIHAAGGSATTAPRSTSSEGCQTIPGRYGLRGSQYDSFISLVASELKRNNAKTVSYVLTSRKDAV